MRIERGTCRIAIVGKEKTVKFPKIDLTEMIRSIKRAIKNDELKSFLTRSEKRRESLAYYLKGWFENLRERRLSKEVNDILVPTRLSILGLLNVQDTAEDAPIEAGEIWNALAELVSEYTILEHGGHTIAGKNNFGLHNGKIKIRDYGEKGLEHLLQKHQKELTQTLETGGSNLTKNHKR